MREKSIGLRDIESGILLIFCQPRRCLQLRRFQSVDLDPFRVVFDWCAGANRLVVLHTRRTMNQAYDCDLELREDGNVYLCPDAQKRLTSFRCTITRES